MNMNIHRKSPKKGNRQQEAGSRKTDEYDRGTFKRVFELVGAYEDGRKTMMKFAIRNPQSAIRNGFTIVELLVVISIILLLAGILVPSIIRAKDLAYIASTKAYITQLETGALRYQQEQQYFPGQDNSNLLISNGGDYTGSQLLAAAVFGLSLSGNGGFNDVAPTSEYVEYAQDRVVKENYSGDNDDLAFAPRDIFPSDDSYPLLYYPSRLGNDGRVGNGGMTSGAFIWADNVDYIPGNQRDDARNAMRGIIWDTRFGWYTDPDDHDVPDSSGNVRDKAYNADTFLIFGKGMDDRDQAYSWFTPQSPKNF